MKRFVYGFIKKETNCKKKKEFIHIIYRVAYECKLYICVCTHGAYLLNYRLGYLYIYIYPRFLNRRLLVLLHNYIMRTEINFRQSNISLHIVRRKSRYIFFVLFGFSSVGSKVYHTLHQFKVDRLFTSKFQ